MTKKHIDEAWQDLRANILPPHAPAIQLKEMRRAFYAGAQAMMNALVLNVSDTGDINDVTPEDEALIEDIQAELQQFADDLQAGRA
jgi:hypothetical protein